MANDFLDRIQRALTILIVDDDLEFLAHLRPVLEAEGYNVLSATDGADAISVLNAKHAEIDVSIIDLVLPGPHNGFDLIGAISRRPSAMRVLATSAVFTDDQLYLATRVGAHAAIAKVSNGQPISDDEWLAAIRALLPDANAASGN